MVGRILITLTCSLQVLWFPLLIRMYVNGINGILYIGKSTTIILYWVNLPYGQPAYIDNSQGQCSLKICTLCLHTSTVPSHFTLACPSVLICGFSRCVKSQPLIKSKFTFHFRNDEWKIEYLFIYVALHGDSGRPYIRLVNALVFIRT